MSQPTQQKILVRILSDVGPHFGRFAPIQNERERRVSEGVTRLVSANYKELLEARVRIELTHKGFADLSLTTWVPRLRAGRKFGAGDGI